MSSNNLPSVTVDTFTKIIEMQFKERNFRPVFGLGKGGIGKTESIYELAKTLNVGYVDIRLLLYSETDLKGIPYPDANHIKTVWLQNNILPTVEKDGETGILVFDEITSCARSVRTAAYQLLNERKLGEYVLPDGWLVVCLGNGEEDGGDYQGMEGNFANRCSVFNVIPNVDSWKKWAMAHGINPLVSGYVTFKPQDLHSYNPDSETELLFASPRSWKAVSDILNINEYDEKDIVLANRIIANLGLRVGQQFVAFCKFKNKTVDPMTIVRDGRKPQFDREGQKEIVNITIQSTIKIVGDKISSDLIALNGSVSQDAINMLANVISWLVTLRKEYAVMGIKDLIAYNEKVIRQLIVSPALQQACPELLQFVNENIQIFM